MAAVMEEAVNVGLSSVVFLRSMTIRDAEVACKESDAEGGDKERGE